MVTESVDAGNVRRALELAVRAPSLHNSQPWKWRYDDRTVELYANFERWLPTTDTATRDLVLSCGAALHHLRLALATAGIAASVDRRAQPGGLDHLATLRLQKGPAAQADLRMAAMITRRRTDRRRFGDWPVPDVFLDELEACAAREGAVLRVLDRAGDRTAIVEALREAARDQEDVTTYTIETALWTGRPAGDDGIPPTNLLVDAEGTGDGLARRFESGSIDQESGPDGAVLLVIGTASDDAVSRLRAGEALSAVLLHSADVGLATCPLSQPLEVSSTYRILRDDVLGGQLAPQVLVRVGWAPPERLPPTPRRQLDDVIERSVTEPLRSGQRSDVEGGPAMADEGNVDNSLQGLDASACWNLLSQVKVGRLAWTDPDGRIMVVPVNFGLDGHTAVIRTGDTALLDAARAGRRCALQADDLEPGLRSGWTVLVDGRLTTTEDAATAERLGQLVDPWLRVPRPHVLQLGATQVTGRTVPPVGSIQIVSADADE